MITCLCVLVILTVCLGHEGIRKFQRQQTSLLKVVLPWVIILHHLTLKTNMLRDFNEAGVYVVGLFFFISGFGLEKKREGGGRNYS